MMTINTFNRLTGQETLHPLVGIADLSGDSLDSDISKPCNFYALLCNEGMSGRTNYSISTPVKSVYLLSMVYGPDNRRVNRKLVL